MRKKQRDLVSTENIIYRRWFINLARKHFTLIKEFILTPCFNKCYKILRFQYSQGVENFRTFKEDLINRFHFLNKKFYSQHGVIVLNLG